MTAGTPQPAGKEPRLRKSRRGFLGLAVLLGGGVAAARWFNLGAEISNNSLSVSDAHDKALSGQIALIDIRRPDEWARTGIGASALPLDMRDPEFSDVLLAHVDNDLGASIALICARGVRSRGLAKRLTSTGFTHIIDVPEGMLGSGAGPGWIKAGLPVTHP
ncbi:hypothetical protein C1J03_17975 [Sulfitobacter sp. SK012]|uniref:rhodanese-like domain-containing protein n=1 Tax=Sulfitobacter sp. SK012 TaxID=1389005 RepID=UPI000E0B71E2|nr:rhodanese-like domain-containing protein [Sulfitobacter sp. SK012]AXI47726.1 hypothetical protein C1J03_17975 [Sulfitobacter sp. SK012]